MTTHVNTTEDETTNAPGDARRVGMAWTLLITGLIGMGATITLVYERVQLWMDPNHVTSCDINPWVSCGQVMQNWQATLFGFPNQFIGMVAFPIVITVAMTLFAGARLPRWYWLSLNLGVALGFIFCVWLWSQSVFVISVLCLYCIIVWAAMIPMVVLVTVRNMVCGVLPVSERAASLASMLAWPVIVLLYVAVAASILLRFSNAFI